MEYDYNPPHTNASSTADTDLFDRYAGRSQTLHGHHLKAVPVQVERMVRIEPVALVHQHQLDGRVQRHPQHVAALAELQRTVDVLCGQRRVVAERAGVQAIAGHQQRRRRHVHGYAIQLRHDELLGGHGHVCKRHQRSICNAKASTHPIELYSLSLPYKLGKLKCGLFRS